MNKRKSTTVVAFAGLFCLGAIFQAVAAEHVLYDVAKFPSKGTVITENETMGLNNCAIVMEMQGQKVNGSMSRNGEKIRVVTFDSDTQITVEVKKNSSSGGMTMMGQKQPIKEELEPLHGQTVILTKADGTWTGKLKEGEATDEQKKRIAKIAKNYNGAGNDAQIYGKTPRKIGDTWNVDPSKIDSFGADGEDLEGTFKVTFKGIEKFQGEDCAVLVADIDVTGPTGDGDAKMNLKGKARILRSLKNLVDLENKMEGKMKMSGTINQGAGTMKMEGPMIMSAKTLVKAP